MASSLISNSHHIDFDSFFDMDDAGLAQVFETLIATGLRNFLGCPAVFYEEALLEFFANGTVRDGLVVSTVHEVTVGISEQLFAETFELPVEGLTDLSDVPKDKIFDARSLFSASKEQAMVTPGSRQAKGFAIQIGVLLQNVHGLVLGESKGFPKSRILDAKTVHRFVHINEKVGLEESAASPRVKKTPVKKAVSKKTQKVGVEDAPVVKKKRTTKGKPVVIAQEAVPPKIDDATTDAPVEQLSVPKRKSQKRKRKLVLEDAIEVDEPVPASVEQPAVVPVVEGTTEDPDTVINQVLNQLDSIYDDKDDKQSDRAETWFDRAFDEMLRNDSPVVTPSDTDEEEETIDAGAAGGTRRFGQGIEFQEVDAYKASLPQIDASDKGKGILVEDDVQGHPAREIFSLICADIEFLIALREKVIEDVSIFVLSWAETDSSFVAIQRRRLIIAKYRELLLRKFIEARRTNFVSGTPTSAIDLKVLKLLGAAHLFALKDLLRHMREHQLEWTRPSSPSFFEGPVIYEVSSYLQIITLSLPSVGYDRKLWWMGRGLSWKGLITGDPSIYQDLVVRGSVVEVIETLPKRFRRIIQQSMNCNNFVDSVVQLDSADIQLEDVQDFEVLSSDGSTVYRSPSPRQESSSSFSSDESMNFDDTPASISLPAAPIPDVTISLNQLRASIDQIRERDDGGAKNKDTLLLHLHNFETQVIARLDAQDRVLGALHRDSNDQRNLLSLELQSSHKQLGNQIVTTGLDVVDVRRVVRETHQGLNARINYLDEQVAATRNDLLEFSTQEQQTLNIITNQLSELVAYINRGGDNKKGEGSSSRRPLPTPVNQGESSGNVIRTTEIISQTDIDAAQRDIMERMMRADRERDRERRERRLSRSGSYKRRRGY
ncbi:hypothetical protein F511_09074 [Dorcoceras hygrometricum]|uniref:Dystroglycan-like n=1 Tax=Dorcoceras hygrometricum TaxID=472368 RepID=A0A2Z7DG37_9LAMI|nr:hypothetical protein F511_09074 [Dorcoceras hygrometricum]